MEGTDKVDQTINDTRILTEAVRKDLIALRGAFGHLTIDKFSHYETLRRVCGAGDLLDGFLMFEREMRRYIAEGNRDQVAAAISITADADKVLDRFEYVLEHFEEDGEIREQRTARRWSDQGIRTIAAELVYLAELQQRLGGELMTVELSGTSEEGLSLVLWHLASKNLPDRAPLVRFWQYRHDDGFEQDRSVVYDLDEVDAPEASSAAYRLKQYHFQIELPKNLISAVVDAGEAVYRMSIEGRNAPMRTVSFLDDSDVGAGLRVRFTTYRTHVTIEVVKR